MARSCSLARSRGTSHSVSLSVCCAERAVSRLIAPCTHSCCRFFDASAVACCSAGHALSDLPYLTDRSANALYFGGGQNCLRRTDPRTGGTVAVAGTCGSADGYADGVGYAARFAQPGHVAVFAQNRMLVRQAGGTAQWR